MQSAIGLAKFAFVFALAMVLMLVPALTTYAAPPAVPGGHASLLTLYDPLKTPAMPIAKASNAWLMDVAVHGQRVLMVGEHGVVLYADVYKSNTPVRWKQARVPVSVTLTAVAFASAQVAYAVGHDGVVLKSTDAGARWHLVFDGLQANAQVVQAAQAKLQLLQQSAASPTALEEAQWALEDAQAGARFGPTRPFLGVWFRNESEGWVVGSYGQLFYTHNGGQNWVLQTQGLDNPEAKHLNGIVGAADGVLLIAAEAGRVYRSPDFGNTWQRLETGYLGPWFGVLPVPNGGVLAYGLNGNMALKKAEHAPWRRLQSASRYSLVAAVPTAQGAWLLNQKGQLLSYQHSTSTLELLPLGRTKTDAAANSIANSTASAMAAQGAVLWLAGQNGPTVGKFLP